MKGCGRRVGGVIVEGFRALQRQEQALQKEVHRKMNNVVRDESDDEFKEEGNVEQEGEEVARDPGEDRFSRSISRIGKRPKIEVPRFFGNINLKELID